jgi:hypothetical protein
LMVEELLKDRHKLNALVVRAERILFGHHLVREKLDNFAVGHLLVAVRVDYFQ